MSEKIEINKNDLAKAEKASFKISEALDLLIECGDITEVNKTVEKLEAAMNEINAKIGTEKIKISNAQKKAKEATKRVKNLKLNKQDMVM